MVCLPYPFKFLKGCLPQNLLSPLLNTLSKIQLVSEFTWNSRASYSRQKLINKENWFYVKENLLEVS